MKKCPFCAEEIQDEAIKCKHCGEPIPAPQVEVSEEWTVFCERIRALPPSKQDAEVGKLGEADLRLHRGLLQHATTAFGARVYEPERVRGPNRQSARGGPGRSGARGRERPALPAHARQRWVYS